MDAFKQYDFHNDENWKAYIRSVELPARDAEEAMLRVKARWYKKNIDPNFDLNQVSSGAKAQPQPQSARAFGSGGATSGAPAAANSGTGSGTTSRGNTEYTPRAPPPPPPPPPRYGAASSGTYGGVSAQQRLFLMHVGMLLLGVFVVVPFLPYSRLGYVYLMRLSILALGYKIYLQHGLPSFRPVSMMTAWFQRVMPTSDFLQLITALSFSAQPPMVLVAVPLLVLAAYHAAAYCAAHFSNHALWQRYGSRLHVAMLRKQADALLLNAFCEIGTAALLVLQLLTPARSLLTLVFYGQILKLKLHVPDSAPQHRQVWRKINDLTLPYRRQVPALERFIQMAIRWFASVPGAR
ncbi:hypothetical protein VOLCADRAFT_91054 [Volvox carteri f. nagariensis]|uniref:Uncharacterized protein n=1 Tax=Volvox carteri f. nagariensis TaxID=3068 RepID=D8TW23_VOLCA|nr:uncharacterized protein VOLCADRAFT_91054 [Volvox carteri f. nagariensis]EFJ48406.1 hypothetical protein VOLCADRAFT_91054 [Volvox carteri f. nagariensis]|eukprot:XP_002950660.1 hypothetical protein VOLCADRAFT_91054 [Volvox carteri f. nagariensis]